MNKNNEQPASLTWALYPRFCQVLLPMQCATGSRLDAVLREYCRYYHGFTDIFYGAKGSKTVKPKYINLTQ